MIYINKENIENICNAIEANIHEPIATEMDGEEYTAVVEGVGLLISTTYGIVEGLQRRVRMNRMKADKEFWDAKELGDKEAKKGAARTSDKLVYILDRIEELRKKLDFDCSQIPDKLDYKSIADFDE